jgi:hypothetical protein
MSDLRLARGLMNQSVREALESVPIFDPASLDECPDNDLPPPIGMLVDDAMGLDDGGETVVYGRLAPRMPWEVLA